MGRRLNAAGKRAQKRGLKNNSGPTTVVMPCGKKVPAGAAPTQAHHYDDPCVLQKLKIELTDGKAVHPFELSAQRRHEPVAKTVADEYRGYLGGHEIVIEALSAIDIGAKGKHLRINAQAFNGPRHSDQSNRPLHPYTAVATQEVEAGGAVNTQAAIERRNHLQSWAAIWPFSGDRTKHLQILGRACGHAKPAGPKAPAPLKELAAHLVVFPEEEWTFAIEGTKWKAQSKSWTGDVKRQGEKGNHVWASRTVTSKTERGDASNTTSTTTRAKHQFRSTTESQENEDGSSASMTSTTKGVDYSKHSISTVNKDGHGSSYSETVAKGEYSETHGLSQKRDIGPIGSHTYSVSQTDSTEKGLGALNDKSRYKVSDIFSLEVKSAGETATFKPSSLVDDLYTIADIIKDIGQMFSSVKIGWSFSLDYSLFQGTLQLGWGLRWPDKYAESNRVYYVERFIQATGDIKLAEGSIAASIGIQFDKGWLPAGAVALVSVSLKASLGFTPRVDLVYCNWREARQTGAIEASVPGEFSITLAGSATGTARAFGFSRVLKGTADAKFTTAAKMAFSTRKPPSLTASVNFDGLTLNGYYESSGRDPRRVSIAPIELLGPREIMKEKEFWS